MTQPAYGRQLAVGALLGSVRSSNSAHQGDASAWCSHDWTAVLSYNSPMQ